LPKYFVVSMAVTDRLDAVDPAFLHPFGRFGRKLAIGEPRQ
jgi:SpoVK/Ycf46/Vps4 family AAA+-type ATPase